MRGGHDGQVGGDQLAVTDRLVQQDGLSRGGDVQLRGQQAAAGLELRERGRTVASEREHAHQLLVRLLLPRLALDLPLGVVPGLFVVTLSLEVIRQAAQRLEHLPVDLLALQGQPFLEGCAVGHGKPLEEVPWTQIDCGLERARVALVDQRLERSHVQPVVAEGVELQGVVGDQQEGRVGARSPMAWRRLDRA